MPDKKSSTIKLQHFGDHHQAHLLLRPGEKKVSASTVLNFSDHAALNLQVNPDSKASAVFGHSGDTHAFSINADTKGNFEGSFEDKQAHIALNISGNAAKLRKGKIPKGGIVINGDHHKTSLKLNDKGQVSGMLESRNTDSANFKLKLEDGKIKSGTFTHRGKNHESNITLGADGWSAAIAADQDDLRWSMTVNKGEAGLSAGGKLQFDF